MIYIKSLKLKAFRSFVEETYREFPLNGLCLINGINRITNDPSGAGKSSIFYAIAYALDILPSGMSGKDLQCIFTKDPMQVVVVLSTPDGDIEIGRGKKTYVKYPDRTMEGAALLKKEVEKITGVPTEILSSLVFRSQGSKGLFLFKTDSEKKDLLTLLLPTLNTIEKALNFSESIVKSLEQKLELNMKEQDLIKKSMEQLHSSINMEVSVNIEELSLQTKTLEEEIGSIEKEYDQKKKDLKLEAVKSIEKYKEQIALLKKELNSLIEEDTVKESETKKHNEKILKEIETWKGFLVTIQDSKKTLSKSLKEQALLEKQICFTCNRTWDSAQLELEKVIKKIEEARLDIEKEVGVTSKLAVLNSEIKTFIKNPSIAAKNLEIDKVSQQEKEEFSYIMQRDLFVSPILKEKQLELNTKIKTLAKAQSDLENQNKSKSLYNTLLDNFKGVLVQYDKLSTELQQEKDFCTAIGKGGFLGVIFDEILNELVIEVNKIIGLLANMSNITFFFKTEKTTTTGVKKSIVPSIMIAGSETKISSLSGGMQSSLDLAVDLALTKVIENRTGRSMGFYFADEVFNGLGAPSVEACLEILSIAARKKAIFVIDHHSESKEMFSQIINVEKIGNESRIL